jgi:glutamate dehydrogenase/leucine dehydrogenase
MKEWRGAMKQMNPFEIAQRQVDIVKQYLDIREGLLEMLKHTKRDLIVHFPVKMDDGTLKVFTGYRVVQNPA